MKTMASEEDLFNIMVLNVNNDYQCRWDLDPQDPKQISYKRKAMDLDT